MIKVEKWFATWCGPCKVIGPQMDEMHEAGVIDLTSLNIEENMQRAREAGIRGVPTIIVRDDEGNELQRFAGLGPLKQYLENSNG